LIFAAESSKILNVASLLKRIFIRKGEMNGLVR